MKIRLIKDTISNAFTYIFSSFGIIMLALIFVFIFSQGSSLLSFDLIRENYNSANMTLKYENELDITYDYQEKENEYFSSRWGIALTNGTNLEGEKAIVISYVHKLSPFCKMTDVSTNKYIKVEVGQYINKGILLDDDDNIMTITKSESAKSVKEKLNNAQKITNISIQAKGGGIKGSLIATLLLIGLTLLFSLPIGICAAMYLSIYAKTGKFKTILESLIDMTGGIPSIIFGLIGVIIFIPVFNKIISSNGLSILSGAATLTIMLLPIIIKTTKEAIDSIPKSLYTASLALGASETQTTFKIILPNAIPGILTSALLCIGRIIGESAALIFVMGSQVNDEVSINKGGTTLATHIWNLISGENPNYKLACAISIVIMLVVLTLNILVKIIGKKLNKLEVK